MIKDAVAISFPASGDLTSYYRKIVALDSSGRVVVAGGTVAASIGVLGNKPTVLGEGAEVQIGGVVDVIVGGSVAINDFVCANAQGFAIATTTAGNTVIGRVTNGASGSGLIASVLINPQTL